MGLKDTHPFVSGIEGYQSYSKAHKKQGFAIATGQSTSSPEEPSRSHVTRGV